MAAYEDMRFECQKQYVAHDANEQKIKTLTYLFHVRANQP